MEVIILPTEARTPCPRCGKPAAVIDGTAKTVTVACVHCGRSITVAQAGVEVE